MELIKAFLLVTSLIYLISLCFVLLVTAAPCLPDILGFLWVIKWTPLITVSDLYSLSISITPKFRTFLLIFVYYLLDLKLRWNVPCGPNSVITFPGAVWLKPWYWWSWPVLPLGLSWHHQRRYTIRYICLISHTETHTSPHNIRIALL